MGNDTERQDLLDECLCHLLLRRNTISANCLDPLCVKYRVRVVRSLKLEAYIAFLC